MPNEKPLEATVISASEAQRILSDSRDTLVDKATVIRWGRAGRIKIVYQMPGPNGAILFDRASVEALAAELADDEAAS